MREIRQENTDEINKHFSKLGYPPVDVELLKDRYYNSEDGTYETPFMNGYYPPFYGHPHEMRHWKGRHPYAAYSAYHPHFVEPESFKGGKSPSKFLDEMPKRSSKADPEVDGFQEQKYNGNYNLEEKMKKLKNTASPFPTMATV